MYPLLRNLMFKLDAETSHHLGMNSLKWMEMSGLLRLLMPKMPTVPVHVMGLRFPNPVGLAAGLDKNADYLEALSVLGFGFIEVGTVTPRPQPGNAKPRLFRLPEAQAIINRMGFNNLGVDHLLEQVQAAQTDAIIGINIGKNVDTPVDKALNDYLIGLEKSYPHADYITINISSPNTPGLRNLQFGEALDNLLSALKNRQAELAEEFQRYVPMAVKVAPDLTLEEVQQLSEYFSRVGIDAVIATNTTLSREAVAGLAHADEAGGLSGKPVFAKSTEIVRQFRQALPADMPIIAAGGIMSAEDAMQKLEAGAQLIQIYSGLIYQGPKLIQDIVKTIQKRR
ncbi:MAG TPA: quinone-dependent dihydroorotate dehydrogenase [Methylophaga sp.]|jgi:dihydroorotate dehydrogenase|uniref:quinone-dependent dihydroorotate dehydrogenase n=1 Tax=unclassified Methylophaga TaxID=2629249 RepID=UPI000C8E346A|nr:MULTISPECIES: quinone-dependent dihydroorotate dehydrogenase [unclassified Methylophaga]MAP28150.1 dihydroorotate dehydrogenase (quinone) [Methylophaga sp.]HAD31127.1 quinone-dependent dihydroorotate dehydrogenase [Methylophaga sp.]HBX60817.1 quinone-dependent dihydroorotate dehydrogenase [Methylophaga sp.]HCN99612.1 quinone-dependent dihydroorotate dehydrogenase [Methylophaga sp.]